MKRKLVSTFCPCTINYQRFFIPDSNYRTCKEIACAKGNAFSPGVYELTIGGGHGRRTVKAYCDKGGWTVIQSRGQFGNGRDYFDRKYYEYERGFGEPGGQII